MHLVEVYNFYLYIFLYGEYLVKLEETSASTEN
jgi:hypothetical protein